MCLGGHSAIQLTSSLKAYRNFSLAFVPLNFKCSKPLSQQLVPKQLEHFNLTCFQPNCFHKKNAAFIAQEFFKKLKRNCLRKHELIKTILRTSKIFDHQLQFILVSIPSNVLQHGIHSSLILKRFQ